MLQAALLDCLFLDRFPFSENVFVTPEVDVRGSDVVQALVIAVIVVVIDKDTNLLLQVAWQVVVFQENVVPFSFENARLGARNFLVSIIGSWA